MRFLCLHGSGMNSQIFRSHMDRICSALEPDHSFVFVNGSVPTKPFPGAERSAGPYLRFGPEEEGDYAQIPDIVEDLLDLADLEGPFDGVIGFSEGGAAAAQMLIAGAQDTSADRGIKCGIFFCALTPVDLTEISVSLRHLSQNRDGTVLNIPTAHIWSQGGDYHPNMGQDLVGLCNADLREEVIHHLGHEVPGARSDESLKEAIRAIERTIERVRTIF